MNQIVNKFLLAGDKFMPEMHLIDPIVKNFQLVVHLLNTKRSKDFMQDGKLSHISKIILIKLVFNMIWHIVILKI